MDKKESINSHKGTIIIAEAGINHNGNLKLAEKLIKEAANSGADFIKFQTFKADLIISKYAQKAEYQKANTKNKIETQLEMAQKLELSFEDFLKLQQCCIDNSIGFLSTGFDFPSIDFLFEIDVPFFKIPSGEITNKPYLQHIAKKKTPVIMSTGMATMKEIREAIKILKEYGLRDSQIILLHCNTEYPTPMKDVNLKAMLTIQQEFGINVGYSDHTLGIEIPIAAVALGATVIEKHFTLDRNLPGPDHKASLEPNELTAMVNAIRNIELAISGTGKKEPSPSESKNITIARQSIVATKAIAEGDIFSIDNLTTKRPGNGISPMHWDEVIGKKAKHAFNKDEQIKL